MDVLQTTAHWRACGPTALDARTMQGPYQPCDWNRSLTTSPTPRLASLAAASPAHALAQDVVVQHAVELFAASHGGLERLAPC